MYEIVSVFDGGRGVCITISSSSSRKLFCFAWRNVLDAFRRGYFMILCIIQRKYLLCLTNEFLLILIYQDRVIIIFFFFVKS